MRKLIEIPVKWKGRNSSYKIDASYKIIVDTDNNFIVDWYPQFKLFSINCSTTHSHKKTKANSKALWYRKKLLEILNIQHVFGGKQQKNVYYFDIQNRPEEINKINDFFKKDYNSTFQNIEYLISGNNPHGRGDICAIIDNREQQLSFFFQNRNITNYGNFNTRRNNRESYYTLEVLDFNYWIDHTCINCPNSSTNIRGTRSISLKEFLSVTNNIHHQDFKAWNKYLKNDLILYKKIEKQRQILNTKLKHGTTIKESFINKTWNNSYNWSIGTEYKPDFELAHIFPVRQIKLLCIEKNYDWEILDQISDTDNVLPLSSNIHTKYDKFCFYWDEDNGMINFKGSIQLDEINYYKKINIENRRKTSFYLKEYRKYYMNVHVNRSH